MLETPLTAADFQSGTWGRLIEVLESRLESAQRRLESVQSEASSNELRGRIVEIRTLLGLEADLMRTLTDMKVLDKADYSLT